MVKIKEYFQVGNRDELTVERLLILLEDMYKDLALGINSQSSNENMIAWCTFEGNAPVPIPVVNGNNISSITKNGTGSYTLNFITPVDYTTYGVVVSCYAKTGAAFHSGGITSKSENSCTIQTFYYNVGSGNNEAVDAGNVNVYIF